MRILLELVVSQSPSNPHFFQEFLQFSKQDTNLLATSTPKLLFQWGMIFLNCAMEWGTVPVYMNSL